MNRIWIYQSKKAITNTEQNNIAADLQNFVDRWAAHNKKLDARFEILHSHFIILTVNEEEVLASGCSIDDSFRFMQDLESKYGLSLFDRQQMAYIGENGNVQICGLNEIGDLHRNGQITNESLIFNNLIQNADELENAWKIPFKESGFFAFAN